MPVERLNYVDVRALGASHIFGQIVVRVRKRETCPSAGRKPLRGSTRIDVLNRRRCRETTRSRPPLASGAEHVLDCIDRIQQVGFAGAASLDRRRQALFD